MYANDVGIRLSTYTLQLVEGSFPEEAQNHSWWEGLRKATNLAHEHDLVCSCTEGKDLFIWAPSTAYNAFLHLPNLQYRF